MNGRRFTEKPALDPGSVRSLPINHPAMTERRTLFPSTVVEVTNENPERLLVSGRNNRKLGETITKGKFKGYALYGLSLEERATCPVDCAVRGECYGNGMQLARRHKIGDPEAFFDRLGFEICELLDEHDGLMIRLHVLGDFPSTEYVEFWADALNEHPKLAIYGYTARKLKKFGGDATGDAVDKVKKKFPERFRIRWSSKVSQPDGAIVVDTIPEKAKIKEGLVCPAQTDDTACCASCGLCWEKNIKNQCIVFIKHGPKSLAAALETETAKLPEPVLAAMRPVAAIDLPANMKSAVVDPRPPRVLNVDPKELRIEAAYQRDLSGKSIKLIRKIVTNWDWAKFKPPVVAQTAQGLFVIDGQHTAIAAATHQYIKEIPVLIVTAPKIAHRAESFVSHNRDRLTMSALQVFHAEAAAGDKAVMEILKVAVSAGVSIPRSAPFKGYAKPGQAIAVAEMRRIYRVGGAELLGRVLRIAAASKQFPIATTLTRSLEMICREPRFKKVAALSDARIAAAIATFKAFERDAQAMASDTGQNRYRAAALLIVAELGEKYVEAAA